MGATPCGLQRGAVFPEQEQARGLEKEPEVTS